MANETYLAHLEDLIDEARANPDFNLILELSSLVAAMLEEGVPS